MFIPGIVSFFHGESLTGLFMIIGFLVLIIGITLNIFFKKDRILTFKYVVITVLFGWLLISVIGALPYLISGYIPSFVDALFESISGFTTTGATILTNIEALPISLLFWRSLTHWLGGIGIILLIIAVLPSFGLQGTQLFQAEVSGGTINKRIQPRIKDTALLLLGIYTTLTVLEIVLLMIGGLNFIEATIHSFGTLATGGFSSYSSSIGHFASPFVHYVIILFMILAGANFILYCRFVLGQRGHFLKNEEFRLYLIIILIFTFVITRDLWGKVFFSFEEAFRMALFHVVSVMTTTGFVIVDFDLWPNVSKMFLFTLMFVGGCVGSTGSSIKVMRIYVLLKSVGVELLRIIHPMIVKNITIEDEVVPHKTVRKIVRFIMIYVFIFMLGSMIMSFFGLDMVSALSSTAATLGNVGPGFGLVGATESFAFLPPLAKIFLSFFMLLGRLELFTILVLLIPAFWKN